MRSDEAERFAEAVLSLVELIPPGRVMAYGMVAAAVGGGGPRRVGAVLSRDGAGVPWWRVVHADGSPPPGREAASAAYAGERTPLRGGPQLRIDMGRAAWWPPATPPP